MSWTLQEIIDQISSEIDQSSSSPAVTDTKYALRRTYINRSLKDFSEAYDWPSLLVEVNTRASTGSISVNNLATISMPTDFRKLATFPLIVWDGSLTSQFAEVDTTAISQYNINDLFVYFLRGNPTVNMIVHALTMVSGASINYKYFATPASLASPVNVANIPDSSYLVQRAVYYEYKASEDSRFIDADQKSELILRRLLENEVTRGVAYQQDRVPTWLETKRNFRIGRD